jgi:hypothetical protein
LYPLKHRSDYIPSTQWCDERFSAQGEKSRGRSFLRLALHEERSCWFHTLAASPPRTTSDTHSVGGLFGPTAGLDALEKKNPLLGTKP